MRLRQKPSKSIGLNPWPEGIGYVPGVTVNLYGPMGNIAPSEQKGRYGAAIPTQVAGVWPGVQMKCGVEGLQPRWDVQGNGDTPYWLRTQYGESVGLQRTGARPTGQLGPATVSTILGPARRDRAAGVQQMASGLLGW